MTSLEGRLSDALHSGGQAIETAVDLFARVHASVEDDRRRRGLIRRSLVIAILIFLSLASIVFAVTDYRQGRLLMDWWVLELLTTAVLIGLALWLGPFIKRFGRGYAADVFRANPRTGKSFIVLVDIVYYLIFIAYILFTVRFEPDPGWRTVVGADQLQYEVARLGGIILTIGVLHGLNLLIMPVLGRLFTLNRRLDEKTPPQDL
jgi:hypothetical protein